MQSTIYFLKQHQHSSNITPHKGNQPNHWAQSDSKGSAALFTSLTFSIHDKLEVQASSC
jgi:hypothetical protein